MRYLSYILILPIAAIAAEPTEQAKRGKEMFNLKSATGVACSSCHQVAGEGTPVGPDLKTLGRLAPRAVMTGIMATRTQYVREITTASGKSFPAIKSGETYYDLSKTPPAPVTLSAGDIRSAKDNVQWKHPPESRGLTKQQLADVIAYMRFAFLGDTKGVAASEIP
jgi:hypothetical protein